MREAAKAGYKVYLYFIATESPVINNFRVQARVMKHGHNVDADTVTKRYHRSLNFLFDAAQTVYRAYFFDNSKENEEAGLFAQFKVVNGKKKWKIIQKDKFPEWFKLYYSSKVFKSKNQGKR